MKNIQLLVKKSLELVQEIETYSFYKDTLDVSLKRLFADYQAGKFTYFEYEKQVKRFLKGKSRDEWINYYNAYILSLMKRLEAYNSQIFYEAYNNRDHEKIGIAKPKPVAVPVKHPAPELAKKAEKPQVPEFKPEPRPEPKRPEPAPTSMLPELGQEVPVAAKLPEPTLVELKPSLLDRISLFFRHLFVKKDVDREIQAIKKPVHAEPVHKPKPEAGPGPKHVEARKPSGAPTEELGFWAWLFGMKKEPAAKPAAKRVKKPGFWDWLLGTPQPAPKPSVFAEKTEKKPAKTVKSGIAWGHFMGVDYIRNLLAKSRKVQFSEKKEAIPTSTIRIETLRRKAKPEISTQIEKITATSLTKEAHRIKNIMEKRKALKIYQPSFFGAVANVMIKKISLFLLDNFPDFFKDLYHALRLANIKVLSNTYVNMMVLGVLASTAIGIFVFGLFFSVTALPIEQMIFRTIMMAALMGLGAFAGFYAYPYSKVKARRRSINTNLPFAINHMAAVSSSGVAPVRMFKLISESKEYGDVSVEIEKIVNYVEIFGYDVLTALKAVASTTPSYHFKDFLEGMVSTTQTGGDIKAYFSQKAEEAMLNYKLERQKYTETVSTYSDIYTGILIAAPLFFVAALSLVSLLGGKVGGMNVNVVIVIGTYVIIPFMNVAFMTFLELTQPEI
ncbi:type II secretion system F family protein [Candidatus Woesearchaeota archaeon]|nr:type II secretion system F family protein [Candidatus Woesearchaeota archaeon]